MLARNDLRELKLEVSKHIFAIFNTESVKTDLKVGTTKLFS